MQKKKIMVVTTGRADYGLLSPLICRINENFRFDLQLIATGTHLSALHGQTIQLIEADQNVKVADTLEMTPKDDTEDAICSSVASGLAGFSQLLVKYRPDLLFVLGDRYELWSACLAAVIHKIPIAHIHGGETTYGIIDDSIRHSVTKMAAFHFASIELYAKRIIQMGEHPERVFVVGAIGLDNIKSTPLMARKELSEYAGVNFEKKVALMTYHPVTLDSYESAGRQIKAVLDALIQTDLLVIMTMPNSDTSGRIIYQALVHYCEQYPEKFKLIKNLGQRGYLSAMKYARLMVGNSSSGIIESASFQLPVVNIGDRQAGRFKPSNVIDCDCEKDLVIDAVNRALSDQFKQSIAGLTSPYGDGNTAKRILSILESIDLTKKVQYLKKGFFDINHSFSNISIPRAI